MSYTPGILIVDDEEHIRKIMTIMLRKRGYECLNAASGEEALALVKRESIAVVLTDLKMPGMDGLQLLDRIKTFDPEIIVIVVTAYATIETAISAMKAGAYDYISKPFNEEEVVLILEKALEKVHLVRENKFLKKQIEERTDQGVFLGESQAMRKVFGIIAKVAETKATVLITGESGTGKELAARSIHLHSPRRDKNFMAVNCGAIPANLMESEFFGYARGAFTGAERARPGLLLEADGGTIFLDEITELPLEMQVKFLRVLQEEEVRKVGENTSRNVDLRVIAATNKSLTQEIQNGRFREDLYYRLNVVRLQMPPLRERKEDIPLLATHFLKEAVVRNDLGPKKLSPAALKLLTQQTFSGNVRALRNVLEQAAIMSNGKIVGPDDLLFPQVSSSDGEVDPENDFVLKLPQDWIDLKQSLKVVTDETEKEIISRALKSTDNNISKASVLLGLSRRSLTYKISDLKIEISKKSRGTKTPSRDFLEL
jgi:DNA-binding NtrC family response regulator